jgi:hypothetical protein
MEHKTITSTLRNNFAIQYLSSITSPWSDGRMEESSNVWKIIRCAYRTIPEKLREIRRIWEYHVCREGDGYRRLGAPCAPHIPRVICSSISRDTSYQTAMNVRNFRHTLCCSTLHTRKRRLRLLLRHPGHMASTPHSCKIWRCCPSTEPQRTVIMSLLLKFV